MHWGGLIFAVPFNPNIIIFLLVFSLMFISNNRGISLINISVAVFVIGS